MTTVNIRFVKVDTYVLLKHKHTTSFQVETAKKNIFGSFKWTPLMDDDISPEPIVGSKKECLKQLKRSLNTLELHLVVHPQIRKKKV